MATPERGGVSASRRLRAVCRGNVALVGDASGSVDAITGEGLCLLFQQAVALAGALEAGDLALYQAEHRRIGKRPRVHGGPDAVPGHPRTRLRRRTMRALASNPALFRRHAGHACGRTEPACRFLPMESLWDGKFSPYDENVALFSFRNWLAPPCCAAATLPVQHQSLQIDPAQTKVEFTLADVLHTVHGTFVLKRGTIRFDPATGKASGELVVDAASGESGNGARDRRMHKDILESDRYPEIVFRPDRVEGQGGAAGRVPGAASRNVRHPRRRSMKSLLPAGRAGLPAASTPPPPTFTCRT